LHAYVAQALDGLALPRQLLARHGLKLHDFRIDLRKRRDRRHVLDVGDVIDRLVDGDVLNQRVLLGQRSRRQPVPRGSGRVEGAQVAIPGAIAAVVTQIETEQRIVHAAAKADINPGYEAATAVHGTEKVAKVVATPPRSQEQCAGQEVVINYVLRRV